jgi:armadillo repeat-containing protein 6
MRTHISDAKLQDHGLATIAAMSLRSPDNARRLVAMGATLMILKAMQSHPTVTMVQRQVGLDTG